MEKDHRRLTVRRFDQSGTRGKGMGVGEVGRGGTASWRGQVDGGVGDGGGPGWGGGEGGTANAGLIK